jgi:hypothetical protein
MILPWAWELTYHAVNARCYGHQLQFKGYIDIENYSEKQKIGEKD